MLARTTSGLDNQVGEIRSIRPDYSDRTGNVGGKGSFLTGAEGRLLALRSGNS
jgi:hypothetical protein